MYTSVGVGHSRVSCSLAFLSAMEFCNGLCLLKKIDENETCAYLWAYIFSKRLQVTNYVGLDGSSRLSSAVHQLTSHRELGRFRVRGTNSLLVNGLRSNQTGDGYLSDERPTIAPLRLSC